VRVGGPIMIECYIILILKPCLYKGGRKRRERGFLLGKNWWKLQSSVFCESLELKQEK
jgi:hypothetical protein